MTDTFKTNLVTGTCEITDHAPPAVPGIGVQILGKMPAETRAVDDDAPCCGPPPGPPSGPDERPGYKIFSFVDTFLETPLGRVPRVKTRWDCSDWRGTMMARLGVARDRYRVAPGIYAIGHPDGNSPVLVTCNYKLTFDILRKGQSGLNAWLLVLDTRGINVWCAAGKGTFGTAGLVDRIRAVGLVRLVAHRRLVLPQFGATGVCALSVRKATGFKVIWGPVRAGDIIPFLKNGAPAETTMRRVTFTLAERAVLVPVEFYNFRKALLWALLAGFVLSGIGSSVYSLGVAFSRGMSVAVALLMSMAAGCLAMPLLLPWLPGRAFAVKGAFTGIVAAAIVAWLAADRILEVLALMLLTTTASSYLAMSFTGSTPYTSPTGVEKEMRVAIPVQAAAVLVATVIWLLAGIY
jgi:hypothetical protein